jgi:hypothetical protein
VQQIEIEIVSAETGEARLASARDAISGHVIGLHLGDQEYAVTLTGNYVANQFLGTAFAVTFRRVDQRHAKRNACAQCFFFNSCRTFSLPNMPGALTEDGNNGAIVKFYRPSCTR